MFDTPPPSASTRALPGGIQPASRKRASALSAVISVMPILRCLFVPVDSLLMTVRDYPGAERLGQRDIRHEPRHVCDALEPRCCRGYVRPLAARSRVGR